MLEQLMQLEAPELAWYVPTPQFEQEVAEVDEHVPTGQDKQDEVPYIPAEHERRDRGGEVVARPSGDNKIMTTTKSVTL